jgi:methylated-DNA-[protein]-cysteine S-methyltransferase
LRGEATDLSSVVLDMETVPAFHRRVYEVARRIPPGKTLSYGDIAARLGAGRAARAVGQALGRNPFAIVVPCHRVLAAGGRVGGFSANGGLATKLRMLTIEGAHQHAAPAPAAPTRTRGASSRAGAAATRAAVTKGAAARAPRRRPAGKPAAGGFTFDTDAAVTHLRAADAGLKRLIDAVGPFTMTLERAPSLFFALAEAIVYQQLTGRAAATIFGRVQALFPGGKRGPTAAQILSASDAQLRGAGLSGNKTLALRDLARRAEAGEIPRMADLQRLDDEAIVERLTPVRGIGRWTVQMLLMFRLGRADVLPVDDYGIRKGFAITFRARGGKDDLPDAKVIAKRAERWRPYRTVACWYLWRAVERARAGGKTGKKAVAKETVAKG